MLKRLLIFAGVYGALSIFWWQSYEYFFMGTDEFFVFSHFAGAADIGELTGFVFTPHNRHLAPVFKAFFYIEYALFGASSAPYHAVSIGLYSISAMLLWRFIQNETDDTLATFLCTAAYMFNTVYYSVIIWVFLQQFIVTLIFIELALLSAQRSIQKDGGLISAGICCLLASMCLSFGAAAWLFTAAYYLIRLRALPSEGRPSPGRTTSRLLALVVSAAATLALYFAFFTSLAEEHADRLAFSPLLVAKGVAVILGDIMLDLVGTFHIVAAVAEYTGTPVGEIMPMLRAAIFASFFAALAFSLYMLRKLRKDHRLAAISGLLLSALSAAMIVGASLTSWDYDVYQVTNIIRYKYFPFFFLLLGGAPFLAHAGKRVKTALLIILPLLIIVHASINRDLRSINSERINAFKAVMTFVQRSVDRPIVRHEGDYRLQKTSTTNSRIIEDVVFFKGQPMHYVDLLRIYKKPGEVITGQDDKLFYLKKYLDIAPADTVSENASVLREKGTLRASGEGEVSISIKSSALPGPSPFQHLHMRVRGPLVGEAALYLR
jgi:hypothetical protein